MKINTVNQNWQITMKAVLKGKVIALKELSEKKKNLKSIIQASPLGNRKRRKKLSPN